MIFFLVVLGVLLFSYSFFIERNLILVKEHKINLDFNGKFVLLSDFHLGLFKGKHFLERVVKKVNQIEGVSAVFILGDFVYLPEEKNLSDLLSPLREIKYPTFAIFGNHDMIYKKKLREILEQMGIVVLENEWDSIKGTKIKVLGLGDRMALRDDISKINLFKKEDNLIVLAHNPDIVLRYKNNIPDITFSGHTHGGQIRIPFLYKKIIPCKGDFDEGFYFVNNNKVFVSAGLGEVLLPLRFAIPPRIDVIEIGK